MSNISKRLLMGARKFSSAGDYDDNASVTSDTSVNTADNSWMQRLRISAPGDSSLDDMMKSLYEDPDILEEKCKDPYGENTTRRSFSQSDSFVGGQPASTLSEVENDCKEEPKTILRRRSSVTKMIKSPEFVINNLDKQFFTPDFDPVLHQLHALEQWDSAEMMERFMSTIEETDTDKDMVLVKLAEMIEINYSELMGCMRDVHAIDVDLTRTGFQITNSRRKLESGKKLIVTGTMDIARLSRYRNNLASVTAILRKVQDIQHLFASLQNCITIGDLGQAAECARELLVNLQNEYYDEAGGIGGVIHAVEEFSGSVQHVLPIIRQKTDKALFRLTSRKFSTAEYESIVKSYLVLDEMQENMGVCVVARKINAVMSSPDDVVDPTILYDEEGCVDGLPRRVQRYHMSDIRLCLHTAVLEFMYAELNQRNSAVPHEIMSLDELSLEELYERATSESFVPCIVRSCELLADIIHTNYLITQWHTKPFDTRNADESFLHRCGMGGDTLNEDVFDEKQSTTVDSNLRKYHQLSAVNENIVGSRLYLWKEVELAVVELLRKLSPTEAISLDDFVCMIWTLRKFCKLGQEFGGTACSALLSAIEEQSVQYARHIHIESCQLLQHMVATEPWQSVPIQLGEVGGIFGVLRMNMGMDKQDDCNVGAVKSGRGKIILKGMIDEAIARSKHKTNATVVSRANLAAKYSSGCSPNGDIAVGGGVESKSLYVESSSSILMRFYSHGNPFHAVSEEEAWRPHSEHSDITDLPLETDINVSYLTEMLSTLFVDENGPSKRSQERAAAMVVTQTCLRGLAKFSGQYLQLMQLLPSASCEIFEGLCQLFDFYLYAVFMGFVSTDDRYRLLTEKTRSNAPPPQQAQEFDALKTCMQFFLNQSHGKNSDKALETSNPFISLQLIREVEEPPVVQQADPTTYFALNERIVAAESCWFAAKVLSELNVKFIGLLPDDYEQKVKMFTSDFQQVADQLRSLIYRTMCPSLIDQASLMHQLVEQSGWDQRRMREEPHEWVDVLVNHCTGVWEYMEDGEQFAEASAQVREQVWLEICQCAFDTVLEGLSRVRKCSTEGRASMTMDISALHTGLNGVHVCRPPRGKQYVDNYVKALYLSDEEIVHWTHQNWQSYSQRHLHGLLNQAMSSVLKKKRLKDALSSLDVLYDQNDFNV